MPAAECPEPEPDRWRARVREVVEIARHLAEVGTAPPGAYDELESDALLADALERLDALLSGERGTAEADDRREVTGPASDRGGGGDPDPGGEITDLGGFVVPEPDRIDEGLWILRRTVDA